MLLKLYNLFHNSTPNKFHHIFKSSDPLCFRVLFINILAGAITALPEFYMAGAGEGAGNWELFSGFQFKHRTPASSLVGFEKVKLLPN